MNRLLHHTTRICSGNQAMHPHTIVDLRGTEPPHFVQAASAEHACDPCRLRHRTWCRILHTLPEARDCLRRADTRVAAGSVLHSPHARAMEVALIRSGVVTLSQSTDDGGRRIVNLLGVGDVVGLEALAEQAPDTLARAWTDVALCRLPAEALRRWMVADAELARAVFLDTHLQLQRSYTWVTDHSCGSLRQRMLRLLLRLVSVFGSPRIKLPSRDDLGAMLGVTLESASRAVSQLRRVGLLRSCGGGGEYEVRVGAVRHALEGGTENAVDDHCVQLSTSRLPTVQILRARSRSIPAAA